MHSFSMLPEIIVCYIDCNTAAYECGVEKQQTYEILVADKNNHDCQHDLRYVVLLPLAPFNNNVKPVVASCCVIHDRKISSSISPL